MGWFDFITDPFKIGKSILDKFTGGDNDDMKRMMNDQMRAYREQTELTRKELETKKQETDAQKRRVEEKQIRALRRSYRPPGLLGTGKESVGADTTTQLGG